MTRLAREHDAVNLAQGFPDFAAPQPLKDAAVRAIRDDVNQYPITWGAPALREAVAAKFATHARITVDPEREVTVCCGATECMIATLLAVTDPGDEVIAFEPFYENYGPDAVLCGATPRYVPLRPPDWSFDSSELRAAFNDKTKAIIVNTPQNPTGKVFSQAELDEIAALCRQHDCLAITDEIYEHILYDGAEHVYLHGLPGMRARPVTISAVSKTYALTGWRVGWCIASPEITDAIRKVHDFLTVGAPHPLQLGAAAGLRLGAAYYETLTGEYRARRELLWEALKQAGFGLFDKPRGAYYVMAEVSGFGFPDGVAFARHLIEHVGVAVVPGSSFFRAPAQGKHLVRFAFCKRLETLERAAERLRKL